MNLLRLVLFVILLSGVAACSPDKPRTFITVDGTHFIKGEKPYYYLGTNFWYGLNLGASGAGGDRERLKRELDRLHALGIDNLRIMAGSEGPDTEPYRMVPAMQTAPGVYNEDVVEGLDYLLNEMKARDMVAVMCLSNFWNWSGGMGQYLVWSGGADSIPYPPPHPGGDWGKYQEFTAQFYSNAKATKMLDDHIRYIVGRTNKISGTAYVDDPTIMSWQLCNEPRGVNNIDAYRTWIDKTSALIKSLDKNHLVTTGSEGTTSSAYAGTDPEKDHTFNSIDYMTIHIWVQNWNVYDPHKADSTYLPSVAYASEYINRHEAIAEKIKKPLVLEEFGISRDDNSHDPSAPVTVRDKYYAALFDMVYQHAMKPNSIIAGCNFWAWGGEGRPRVAEGIWKAGDDFVGDPPHEAQGWYSVYDTDSTTQKILKANATRFRSLGNR